MSINYKNQKGASLIMVMAIMIVIALMIIATSKSTNVEIRTSFDDTDKKASHMLAETTLVLAEQAADEYYKEYYEEIKTTIANPSNRTKTAYFKARNNDKSITIEANKLVNLINDNSQRQAWDINNVFDGEFLAAKIVDDKHNSYRNPLFIVEYFGENQIKARVTVKAWGKSESNATMLQSVIELSAPG